MKTIAERLDELDNQYPSVMRMPKDIRDKYNQLSQQLICQVWEARRKDHGSIHSHLKAGEKDGM